VGGFCCVTVADNQKQATRREAERETRKKELEQPNGASM
jgi:hypothetical protein